MPRFYATTDIAVDGKKYSARIPEGALPRISKRVPEFFVGVQRPETTRFSLANLDNAITQAKKTGGFKRGKRVVIGKAYGIRKAGFPQITESHVHYSGLLNSGHIGKQAEFDTLPLDFDILETLFPDKKVIDVFPEAQDLDFAINYVIHIAKQMPLSLIVADLVTPQFTYLCGFGNLTIDVVYRDRRVIKTYSGTVASMGGSDINLSAGLQKSEGFYKDFFIEMLNGTASGQIRKVTAYSASNNRITPATPFSPAPSAGNSLVIKEWKKVVQNIGGQDYTLIEFAIPQTDNNSLIRRDRMHADLTGDSAEQNPIRAIKNLLLFKALSIDTAAFTTAETQVSIIGNLFSDGGISEQRRLFNILDELAVIGRARFFLNTSGEYSVSIDVADINIEGLYRFNKNIVDIQAPEENALNEVWKDLEIEYRRLHSTGEYRLVSSNHDVNTDEGKVTKRLSNDFIYNKTTADKACDFLAKRKNNTDKKQNVLLNHEARGRDVGDKIKLVLDVPSEEAEFQILELDFEGLSFGFKCCKYDLSVYDYTQGLEPNDPATDDRADFRFTPPDAVSSFAALFTSLTLNTSVNAELSWMNPLENFKEVEIEYKKSSTSVWTSAGKTSGTIFTIAGLIPGLLYDFRATSINVFGLSGGAVLLVNQLAPGDTAPPPTPGTPSIARSFRTFQGSLGSYSKPSDFAYFEWQYTDSGGTSIGKPVTSQDLQAPSITEPGTGSVTRRVKVRAYDFTAASGQGSPSAYSALSSSQSTETLFTEHIGNNEVTNKKVVSNSGTVTSSPLLSTTFTVDGTKPVLIWFRATMLASAGLILGISRSGTQLVVDTPPGPYGPGTVSINYVDTSPPSGTLTYNITAGNIPGAGINNRTLVLEELKV